jgi:2-dehydro-3-deoxygluconokinase
MQVVTFGEAMLRLSPPIGASLEKADQYAVEVGGAEANVTVALARLGAEARWISRLPKNQLGRRIAGKIREHGVDARIIWADEGRVGLYFVELMVAPRPLHVLYDRAGSAFARLNAGDIDESALDGADLLHVTGITPAISSNCYEATMKLVKIAHQRGIDISFDVNYRAKMSSPESARGIVEAIAPMVRFLFVSSADAELLLGVESAPPAQAEILHARYPNAAVIITAGDRGAYAWDDGPYHGPIVPGVTIDRVGRGDAFCAGYLLGQEEGGPEVGLALVYDAERPELFFKAAGWRVVRPGGDVGVRSDSEWDVPEPELAVLSNARGEVVAYSCGNDMSSRSIEGANPLYLPQAKVYDDSCAIGPAAVLAWHVEPHRSRIRIRIKRADTEVFSGEARVSDMVRDLGELSRAVHRAYTLPVGVWLLTGTAIVPPPSYTAQPGDIVRIAIDGLGELCNVVRLVEANTGLAAPRYASS